MSRRISDKATTLPENPHFLEFERSDGDSRGWPTNTVCSIDGDGHVNFMQYVDIDAPAAVRWRVAAGQGAAIALELPGASCVLHLYLIYTSLICCLFSVGPNYVLKSWPDSYRLYDHHKGPQDNPRHDLYLFGMTIKLSLV